MKTGSLLITVLFLLSLFSYLGFAANWIACTPALHGYTTLNYCCWCAPGCAWISGPCPTTTTIPGPTTTTTTIPACAISAASITPDCAGGSSSDCEAGERILMSGTISGDCSAVDFFQIDADSGCDIQYEGGDIQGIFTSSPSIGETSVTGTWTIPSVPPACQGVTVRGTGAGLYDGGPPGSGGINVAYIDTVSGSFRFFGTTTTTTSTTTSTTTTTTTSTTTSTTTTTTIPTNNFRVELYGDYDAAIENSSISIDGAFIGTACSGSCSLCSWSTGLTANINTGSYCGDGILTVTFSDTSYVNSGCNAQHRACIYYGSWHCCEISCSGYGCTNSVTFDCADWSCTTATTTTSTTSTTTTTGPSTTTTSSTTTTTTIPGPTTTTTTIPGPTTTTTTTIPPCTISAASITPNCAGGLPGCEAGNTIVMSGIISGDCSAIDFFQIDADSGCDIQYNGGDIRGIYDATPTIGSTISGTWTIPPVPAACQGVTVFGTGAGLFDGGPPGTGVWIVGTSTVSGSFTFAVVGGTTTTSTTTTTTTGPTTTSTTTTIPGPMTCTESNCSGNNCDILGDCANASTCWTDYPVPGICSCSPVNNSLCGGTTTTTTPTTTTTTTSPAPPSCGGTDDSCGPDGICADCNSNDGCNYGYQYDYVCSGIDCIVDSSVCTETCCNAYYSDSNAYCSAGVCYPPSGMGSCAGTDTDCGPDGYCANCNSNDGCYYGYEYDYICSGIDCIVNSSMCTEVCCDAYYDDTSAYCSGGICYPPGGPTGCSGTDTDCGPDGYCADCNSNDQCSYGYDYDYACSGIECIIDSSLCTNACCEIWYDDVNAYCSGDVCYPPSGMGSCAGTDDECGPDGYCADCNSNDGCNYGYQYDYVCSGIDCIVDSSVCTNACCDAYYGDTSAYCSGGICYPPGGPPTTTTTTTSSTTTIPGGPTTSTSTTAPAGNLFIEINYPYLEERIIPGINGKPEFTKPMPIEFLAKVTLPTGKDCSNCDVYYSIDSSAESQIYWDAFSKAFRHSASGIALDCEEHTLNIRAESQDGYSGLASSNFIVSCTPAITVEPIEKRFMLGASNTELFKATLWNPLDAAEFDIELVAEPTQGFILSSGWLMLDCKGSGCLINPGGDNNYEVRLDVSVLGFTSFYVNLVKAGKIGVYPIGFECTETNPAGLDVRDGKGTLMILTETLPEFALWQFFVLMLISAVLFVFVRSR